MNLNRYKNIAFHLLCLAAALLFAPYAGALSSSAYASTSKLASGNWVKVKVSGTGIYVITKSDASKWGFSDLSKVRVFGYGGAQISEVLNANQVDDLPQVPILRTADKIYFYAQGPISWTTVSGTRYLQVQHQYATAGYYFITDRDDITDSAVPSVSSGTIGSSPITTFTDRQFHENETYSPGETGSYLLGEDFKYSTTQTFKFALTGYVEGSDVYATTAFAAKTIGGVSQLTFQVNGTNLSSTDYDKISAISDAEYEHVSTTSTTKSFKLASGTDLSYTVGYSYTGTLYTARLDYITVNYTRQLALSNSSLLFRFPSGSTSSTYALSNCGSSTHVWDVTTGYSPKEISTTLSGSTAQFTAAASGAREYAAFDESGSFPSPTMDQKIANQNLHGDSVPDMIIISPTEYLAQAKRIAALHEKSDSMRVITVDQNDVFNEFSSGTPDLMAYRKLAKMHYDRGTDAQGHKLGYLLLFGRGTYDNRQLTDIIKADPYPRLLIWESTTGDNENTSYTTDDILGMLADNSGSRIDRDLLTIAVGRMPVKSVDEAKTVVDKLYSYVYSTDFGSWKNNLMFVADDEENGEFMEQSEESIGILKTHGGNGYIYNHLYPDAFAAESQGGGRAYPLARKKMFQKLDDGVLYLGFTGHANEVSWTSENILTMTDINNLYLKRFPLFLTATCNFTRLDAYDTSGGEILYINGKGGAIALISAARLAYIADNAALTDSISEFLLATDKNGDHARIGDILKDGKNCYGKWGHSNDNKLRYFLVGDPAMRLGYPSYTVKLESINGKPVDADNPPVLQARQKVTIKGSIYDKKGNKATSYNGTVTPTLYDAETSVETFGYGTNGKKVVYQDYTNTLCYVKDSVRNGEFTACMTIPGEIENNYSPALLNFYAYSVDGIEANGASHDLYVYGYSDDVAVDTVGPEIKYFGLNSESFTDGSNVNESPMAIATVSDENGINFSSSGIGHEMTLLLDDNISYTDVASYYTPAISGDTSSACVGYINYPLSSLADGNHSLRLKVWDTYGNSSEKTINFNVITGLKPELYDVYTTSNPASVEANFYLKHNRPDATITVTLSVYDLMGREIWSTTETGKSDMYTSFPITWNLTDYAGRRVSRGIYVYRAAISTDGVQESTKAKKLAVTGE
jgi:hypothetical protein